MGIFDKLKEKIKDHAFFDDKKNQFIAKTAMEEEKEPSKYSLLSTDEKKLCDSFDDKYYDAAQCWYEKYTTKVDDIAFGFYEIFDYKKRISALENVIKAYDSFFNNFSKHGKGGEIFFELEFPDVNKEYTPTQFCKEYPLDIENVNCYKWLLQYYIDHKNEVCQIIQDEYIEAEYGSYEEYNQAIQYEQHIKELKSKTVKLIKKNDGILQKDIYKEFDPDDVNFVKSYLKDLSDASKITRVKTGSTYSLHYNKANNSNKKQ